MVRIEWENKKNITGNFQQNKEYYKDKFKKIIQNPLLSLDNHLSEKNTRLWTNKLFWGDNLNILYYLLNDFEEKIDLIYIDPPFFSGTNYHIEIKSEEQENSAVAYQDQWRNNLDSYLQMFYERIQLIYTLLSKTGLIFVHLDWHANHYIRLILDEIFGPNRFVNSIIWYYYNKYSAGKKNLPRAHDTILVYSKSSNYTFNELRIPRENPKKQLKREMVNGVLKNVKDKNGHVVYRMVTDKKMDDVWQIPCMQPASKQWTGFPTQKHHKLLERIIKLGTNKGDLVADFFCGSGTTLLVAEKLNRKWIGCDISEFSIYITRKRILEYLTKEKKMCRDHSSFETYTYLSDKHLEIINSGFFEKHIEIRRKK